MSTSTASFGVQRLKEGARLFARQPGGLLAVFFVTGLVGMLFTVIPFCSILLPALVVAFMQSCRLADQGERITPGVLLMGFRGPQFKTLCKLGLVHLGISSLLSLLVWALVDPKVIKLVESGAMGAIDAKALEQCDPADIYTVMLVSVSQLLIWLGMLYAAPLIYWQQMTVFKSIFYSVVAIWREKLAFVLMLLAWFSAFMALAMTTLVLAGPNNVGRTFVMWVGSLCVVVLWCALYVGYRQIFGTVTHVDTTA